MSDKPSILSPSARQDARALDIAGGEALKRVNEQLIRWVKNPDLCPAALLPWLAWEMSVDTWSDTWPEEKKRAAIKRAAYIHRHRGTKAALRESLSDSPFRSQIVEWFEQTPPGEPYTFRLNVEQKDLPVLMADHQDLKQAVLRAKNLRSWFSIHVYGTHTGTAYGAGYLAATETLWHRISVSRIIPAESDVMLLPGEMKTIPVTLLPANADDKTFTATASDDSVVTVSIRDGALHLQGLKRGQCSVTLATVNGVTATVDVRVVAEAQFVVRVDNRNLPLFFASAGGFTIDYGDGVASDDYTVLKSGGVLTTREITPGTELTLTVKGSDSLAFYRSGGGRTNPLLELIRVSGDRSSMYQFAYGQSSLTKIHPGALDDLPDVTTYAYAFSNCTALSALPAALFAGSPAVTTFAYVFSGCTSLAGIPADLFAENRSVTTYASAFRGCTALETVPAGLFDSAGQVTTFGELFYGCTRLNSLPEGLFSAAVSAVRFSSFCYNCTSLMTLPAGLFTGAVNAEDFSMAFANCTQLSALPAGLFHGLNRATTFYRTFLQCSALASLPSRLFADCVSVTSLGGTFRYCTALTTVPDDLFAVTGGDSLITLAEVFSYCTALTTVPATLFDPLKARISNAGYVFAYSGLTVVPARLFADALNCTTLERAFSDCASLLTAGEGVAAGCTAAVSVAQMFYNCRKLTTVGERPFAGDTRLSNFSRTFSGCTVLPSIPENLFDGCSAAVNFYETFYGCRALTSLPESLFADCEGTGSVNLYGTFAYCESLVSLPAGLFGAIRNRISTVQLAFRHCTSLASVPSRLLADATNCSNISSLFPDCTALSTVGDEVFSGCTALTSAYSVFSGCRALTTTGARLFAGCTALTAVNTLFENCASLVSVGGGLLSGCSALATVVELFKGCAMLPTVPEDTFRECRAMTFTSGMFRSCTRLTGIPDTLFADSPLLKSAENMFYGCTALVSVPPDIVIPGDKNGSVNGMFCECSSLAVDINTLFTQTYPAGYALSKLFYGCSNVTGSRSKFLAKFPSPVTVSGVFERCPKLTD